MAQRFNCLIQSVNAVPKQRMLAEHSISSKGYKRPVRHSKTFLTVDKLGFNSNCVKWRRI